MPLQRFPNCPKHRPETFPLIGAKALLTPHAGQRSVSVQILARLIGGFKIEGLTFSSDEQADLLSLATTYICMKYWRNMETKRVS